MYFSLLNRDWQLRVKPRQNCRTYLAPSLENRTVSSVLCVKGNEFSDDRIVMEHPLKRPSALILLAMALMSSSLLGEDVKRTTDVVYGRKAGMALTLDVFEPARKNGAAIV